MTAASPARFPSPPVLPAPFDVAATREAIAHHDLHRQDRGGRSLRIPRSALPDRILAFAEHYALDALLDREYPTRTENQ